MCLLQNELCPVTLNRHVLKFILGRPIRFHDMAFFDPLMYESFRQLILDAESREPERVFSGADLTFRYFTEIRNYKSYYYYDLVKALMSILQLK